MADGHDRVDERIELGPSILFAVRKTRLIGSYGYRRDHLELLSRLNVITLNVPPQVTPRQIPLYVDEILRHEKAQLLGFNNYLVSLSLTGQQILDLLISWYVREGLPE